MYIFKSTRKSCYCQSTLILLHIPTQGLGLFFRSGVFFRLPNFFPPSQICWTHYPIARNCFRHQFSEQERCDVTITSIHVFTLLMIMIVMLGMLCFINRI